ncbi:MAG: lipocalin-like domain-containing protein [Duncaniella sp.]|nr:lipocalin-like domain-containing protein [Duncaniella sp.]
MRYRINHILRVLMYVAAVVIMTACTRNNGDIGPLFGRWQLDAMSADGVKQNIYNDSELLYVWAFQGNIIEIQTILPHQSWKKAMGIWNYTDDGIELDFSYKDNYGEGEYTQPEVLMIPRGLTRLTFASHNRGAMTLWWVNAEGVRYEYSLTKMY